MDTAEDYFPIIQRLAKALYKYYSASFDYDDAIQEGMIATMKAIESFNNVSGIDLNNYIRVCATRRIIWQAKKMKLNRSNTSLSSLDINTAGQNDVFSAIDLFHNIENIIIKNDLKFNKEYKHSWKYQQSKILKDGVYQ